MWYLVSSVIAPVLEAIINAFIPIANANSGIYRVLAMPAPAFDAFIGGVQIAGLFVDIPVLLLCIASIFGWRFVWLIVRLWRIILEVIPAMG